NLTDLISACPVGWFGSKCQFKCHCSSSDKCSSNGECPGDLRCQAGYFGPSCQYGQPAVQSTSLDSSSNASLVVDGDVSSCSGTTSDPEAFWKLSFTQFHYISKAIVRTNQSRSLMHCLSKSK
ncbi:unnamed protein product, partial [Candidula unifasciata]